VICHGTAISADVPNCTLGEGGKPAKFVSGVIIARNVRAWLKKNQKWGPRCILLLGFRGLRKDRKRCDLLREEFLFHLQMLGAQKPRKKSAPPSTPNPSPSADIAPAPAPF
jgi:hypothetical protein